MTNWKLFTSTGAYDFFIAKFDGYKANYIGSRRFGGKNPLCDAAYGNAAAVDAKDDFFIAGYFSGTLDLGGGLLTSTAKKRDLFLVKYNGAFREVQGKPWAGM